eukprot:4352676-Pyramimonas_sp.AAC.1
MPAHACVSHGNRRSADARRRGNGRRECTAQSIIAWPAEQINSTALGTGARADRGPKRPPLPRTSND